MDLLNMLKDILLDKLLNGQMSGELIIMFKVDLN
jgi:hypothetical protein